MRNVNIEESAIDVEEDRVEIVERKGLGHPDSICDGIAESVSQALCQEYRDRFGEVLHHNTDEAQLVAGSSSPRFGGGELDEAIFILLAGRATDKFNGSEIAVREIARDTAIGYIEENFSHLKPKHIDFEPRIGSTSSDLKEVFSERSSNDTSFGVGYAPLSRTEKTVLEAEKAARDVEGAGTDVKIMGVREGDSLEVTVAVAGVDSVLSSRAEYEEMKRKVEEKVAEIASEHDLETSISVNAADTEDSPYLTVTGTSAEMGDDGSVGRGNRVNGLITPNRLMSMEACSGKNPRTHVGKIYNLKAKRIAREIYNQTSEPANVKIVSRIGDPVEEPQTVDVKTDASDNVVEDCVSSVLSEKEINYGRTF